MATVRFHEVLVTRDANTIIPRQVSGWELAVLEELYPDGNVQSIREFVREKDLPEVSEEMARLTRIYGSDEESKVPFVEIVYGRSSNGMRQLQRAMEQSMVDEAGEAKRGPGRPPNKQAAA